MDYKNESMSCPMGGCGFVGYAYVPCQQLEDVYCVDDALNAGTLFPVLNLTMAEYGKIGKQVGGIVCE